MHPIPIYIFILMRLLMDNYHLTKRCGHQEYNNYTIFSSISLWPYLFVLLLYTSILLLYTEI